MQLSALTMRVVGCLVDSAIWSVHGGAALSRTAVATRMNTEGFWEALRLEDEKEGGAAERTCHAGGGFSTANGHK